MDVLRAIAWPINAQVESLLWQQFRQDAGPSETVRDASH